MEIAKCIRCGNLYSRVKTVVCPKCEIEEEKEIFQVQRFMRDNPGLTLTEISDALNIYLEDIDRWIEEKRLNVEVTQVSDKKDVVRKLYDTVKGGIEQESHALREKSRTILSGSSDFLSAGGKYRRA